MRKHYEQAVLSRLVQERVLEVEPDLLVDIYTVKRGPFRVVAHHLIADDIGGVAYTLLEQGYSRDREDVLFAALAAPLR